MSHLQINTFKADHLFASQARKGSFFLFMLRGVVPNSARISNVRTPSAGKTRNCSFEVLPYTRKVGHRPSPHSSEIPLGHVPRRISSEMREISGTRAALGSHGHDELVFDGLFWIPRDDDQRNFIVTPVLRHLASQSLGKL